MKPLSLVLAALLPLAACASARIDPRPAAALPRSITERGDAVYQGRVFPLHGSAAAPTYVYERRVAASDDGAVISTHVTRDLAGRVQLAESATHSPDYALSEYTLHADQRGRSGSVQVRADEVLLRIRDESGERTRVAARAGDVVAGPTLVGHVVRHLPKLMAGRSIEVQMVVLDRLETIGFALERVDAQRSDQTRIKMSATNFLYRLAIDPIYFTFERATQKLVRLEGRVPPKVLDDGELKDFDARVEYQFAMARYR